jgi:hypothetical protein
MIHKITTDKKTAIFKVLETLGQLNIDDVYYYGLTTINDVCIKTFKNHFVLQDITFDDRESEDYKRCIDIKKMILHLKNNFIKENPTLDSAYSHNDISESILPIKYISHKIKKYHKKR